MPRPQPNRRSRGGHQRMARLDYRTSNYFARTPKNEPSKLEIPNWLLLVLGIVVVLLFIIWFFTKAPWLRVKDIKIEGEATEETKAEIETLRGDNILWLSVTNPESAILKRQPNIKEIQILRGIPDTLRVKLIERQPSLIWQVNDQWYTLDPYGFAFKVQNLNRREDGSLDLPGTDLPVIVDTKNLGVAVGQTVVRQQFVTFMRDLKDRLPKEVNLTFVRGEIGETSYSTTVVTNAGWNVLFDTTRSLDAQLRTLTKVLETKRNEVHNYIDVRVRGWVYYR
jgi:cell division septal protein FtsQ